MGGVTLITPLDPGSAILTVRHKLHMQFFLKQRLPDHLDFLKCEHIAYPCRRFEPLDLPFRDFLLDLHLFLLDHVPLDTGKHGVFLALDLHGFTLLVGHLHVGVSCLLKLELLLELSSAPVLGCQFVLLDPAAGQLGLRLASLYFPDVVPLELIVAVLCDF